MPVIYSFQTVRSVERSTLIVTCKDLDALRAMSNAEAQEWLAAQCAVTVRTIEQLDTEPPHMWRDEFGSQNDIEDEPEEEQSIEPRPRATGIAEVEGLLP